MTETHPLFDILIKEYPKQCHEVFSYQYCELDPSFLGFTDAYEALSKLIPKHWTIIDIGCAQCAQAYYFRDHKLYIGVDPANPPTNPPMKRFSFSNTVFWNKSIIEATRYLRGIDFKTVFGILNYVPCKTYEHKLVRQTFPNLFCYYPHDSIEKIVMKIT